MKSLADEFIKTNSGGINKPFYLSRSLPMLEAIEKQLADLQVDKKSIVKEAF